MPSAAPCQPVAAPVVAQNQTVETPAVAGSEDVDDEVVAATVLENAKVAAEMNKLIMELQTQRKYVGTSAFLIFALRYRLRVIMCMVWYALRGLVVRLRTLGQRCYYSQSVIPGGLLQVPR